MLFLLYVAKIVDGTKQAVQRTLNANCIVRYVSLIIFAQVVNPGLSWKGE